MDMTEGKAVGRTQLKGLLDNLVQKSIEESMRCKFLFSLFCLLTVVSKCIPSPCIDPQQTSITEEDPTTVRFAPVTCKVSSWNLIATRNRTSHLRS